MKARRIASLAALLTLGRLGGVTGFTLHGASARPPGFTVPADITFCAAAVMSHGWGNGDDRPILAVTGERPRPWNH